MEPRRYVKRSLRAGCKFISDVLDESLHTASRAFHSGYLFEGGGRSDSSRKAFFSARRCAP